MSERRLQSITDAPTLAQSIVWTQRGCEMRGAPERAVNVPPLAAEWSHDNERSVSGS